MKEKTCVVVGAGLLGSMHAERLQAHPGTTVVALCDVVPEKARACAENVGCAAYTSMKEMLADHHPDIVVVATQDPYHTEPLLAACEAGVPYVICEKPLTTTLEDALRVQQAAEASGTQIKVLFPNRLYPLDQSIRLLLQKGFLGEPAYGELRMDDNISVPLKLWGKDSKQYASISNPVQFLFSHAVDLLYFYLSPRKVKKVYAISADSVIGSHPDYMDAYLTFDDGVTMRIKTEWTKRIGSLVENYVQMTATKGGLTSNKSAGFRKKEGLQIFIDGPRERAAQAQAYLNQAGITAKLVAYDDPMESYALELDPAEAQNTFDWGAASSVFADSFDGAEPVLSPLTDLAGGVEQVRVVDALFRSAREGVEVALDRP